MLINEREKVGINKLKNPKAFLVYSQTIDDVYENLEDYNPTKERKVLTVFDDKIADIEANKKLSCREKIQHFGCFYIKILFESA